MRLLNEIRNYMGNYHVKSGVYHFYRGEFTQAIGFLRKALSDEPTLTEGDRKNARCYLTLAHKGQAERLVAKGELQAAVEELGQASGVGPAYPDIHYFMAQLLEDLGRAEEAIEAYRKAIVCNPHYQEAQIALAYCLLHDQQTEEAAAAFEQALAERLDRIERPFRKGIELLQGGGSSDEALEFMHEVFRAVPPLADELHKKALDSLRAREYDKALTALGRALEFNPKYPDLHNVRGIVLCELDRYDEAIEAFTRSAALSPGHMVPRLNLAFTHLRAGRPREAEVELESIVELEPTEPVASAKLEELRASRQADKRSVRQTNV